MAEIQVQEPFEVKQSCQMRLFYLLYCMEAPVVLDLWLMVWIAFPGK